MTRDLTRWPPDLTERDFRSICQAGRIPQMSTEQFREALLGAHGNAWNAQRSVDLMPTKKQTLDPLYHAEGKLKEFRQALQDERLDLETLLHGVDARNAVLAGERDGDTLRRLSGEAGNDLEALDRIALRLAGMIAEAESRPDWKEANNKAIYWPMLIRTLAAYWREELGRTIENSKTCEFRGMMHELFVVFDRPVMPNTLGKLISACLN